MNHRTVLECDRCGAPMQTNQGCDYCGTQYYLGPELPHVLKGHAKLAYEGHFSTESMPGTSGTICVANFSSAPIILCHDWYSNAQA